MFDFIWDYRGYFFWLLVLSVFCWLLERVFPWRRSQRVLRRGIAQDVFWLVFNGHYAGLLLSLAIAKWITPWESGLPFKEWNVVATLPLSVQFVIVLVLKDFVEWCVHNALHRIPWLWEFHKVHHTIAELDWIGNFRFHWMEILVYRTATYLPLAILGVDGSVLFALALVSTLIGHLNHSNVRIDWGPLRYVLNSSRMHVWHHDVVMHHRHGQNYGIVLSVWDWVFGTAYWPEDREQPERLGFEDQESYPSSLAGRILYPLSRLFR